MFFVSSKNLYDLQLKQSFAKNLQIKKDTFYLCKEIEGKPLLICNPKIKSFNESTKYDITNATNTLFISEQSDSIFFFDQGKVIIVSGKLPSVFEARKYEVPAIEMPDSQDDDKADMIALVVLGLLIKSIKKQTTSIPEKIKYRVAKVLKILEYKQQFKDKVDEYETIDIDPFISYLCRIQPWYFVWQDMQQKVHTKSIEELAKVNKKLQPLADYLNDSAFQGISYEINMNSNVKRQIRELCTLNLAPEKSECQNSKDFIANYNKHVLSLPLDPIAKLEVQKMNTEGYILYSYKGCNTEEINRLEKNKGKVEESWPQSKLGAARQLGFYGTSLWEAAMAWGETKEHAEIICNMTVRIYVKQDFFELDNYYTCLSPKQPAPINWEKYDFLEGPTMGGNQDSWETKFTPGKKVYEKIMTQSVPIAPNSLEMISLPTTSIDDAVKLITINKNNFSLIKPNKENTLFLIWQNNFGIEKRELSKNEMQKVEALDYKGKQLLMRFFKEKNYLQAIGYLSFDICKKFNLGLEPLDKQLAQIRTETLYIEDAIFVDPFIRTVIFLYNTDMKALIEAKLTKKIDMKQKQESPKVEKTWRAQDLSEQKVEEKFLSELLLKSIKKCGCVFIKKDKNAIQGITSAQPLLLDLKQLVINYCKNKNVSRYVDKLLLTILDNFDRAISSRKQKLIDVLGAIFFANYFPPLPKGINAMRICAKNERKKEELINKEENGQKKFNIL